MIASCDRRRRGIFFLIIHISIEIRPVVYPISLIFRALSSEFVALDYLTPRENSRQWKKNQKTKVSLIHWTSLLRHNQNVAW